MDPFPRAETVGVVSHVTAKMYLPEMFHTRNQVKPADCFKLKRAVMRQPTGTLPIYKNAAISQSGIWMRLSL
jgi:hypothetical protein